MWTQVDRAGAPSGDGLRSYYITKVLVQSYVKELLNGPMSLPLCKNLYEPLPDRGAATDCDRQASECAQAPGLHIVFLLFSITVMKFTNPNFQIPLLSSRFWLDNCGNLTLLQAQRNELNAKVRMLREELQHLQEQCSYVGEVTRYNAQKTNICCLWYCLTMMEVNLAVAESLFLQASKCGLL